MGHCKKLFLLLPYLQQYMNTAHQILSFLANLQLNIPLPSTVVAMNPFRDEDTKRVCQIFYNKFYGDEQPRHFILGINPGRFGGGITGIPFTDPIRLKENLAIENSWAPRQELSSVFIYEMIEAFGGAAAFYSQFYITSFSPLGFTSQGKNLNYYDNKELAIAIEPFALKCLQKQMAWGRSNIAFCLGEGANFKFISRFNQHYKIFNRIIPLAHPRFIMQYKLKSKQLYIDKYLQALTEIT